MAESRSQDMDQNTLEKLEYVLKDRIHDYANLIYFVWSLEKETFNAFQSIVKSHKKDSEGLKMFVESEIRKSKSGIKQVKEDVSTMMQGETETAGSDDNNQMKSSNNIWQRIMKEAYEAFFQSVCKFWGEKFSNLLHYIAMAVLRTFTADSAANLV